MTRSVTSLVTPDTTSQLPIKPVPGRKVPHDRVGAQIRNEDLVSMNHYLMCARCVLSWMFEWEWRFGKVNGKRTNMRIPDEKTLWRQRNMDRTPGTILS